MKKKASEGLQMGNARPSPKNAHSAPTYVWAMMQMDAVLYSGAKSQTPSAVLHVVISYNDWSCCLNWHSQTLSDHVMCYTS